MVFTRNASLSTLAGLRNAIWEIIQIRGLRLLCGRLLAYIYTTMMFNFLLDCLALDNAESIRALLPTRGAYGEKICLVHTHDFDGQRFKHCLLHGPAHLPVC